MKKMRLTINNDRQKLEAEIGLKKDDCFQIKFFKENLRKLLK
jgi:hypothetical protein